MSRLNYLKPWAPSPVVWLGICASPGLHQGQQWRTVDRETGFCDGHIRTGAADSVKTEPGFPVCEARR